MSGVGGKKSVTEHLDVWLETLWERGGMWKNKSGN